MRITLASVISLDGKTTRADDPDIHAWSSAEDWEHFVKLREEHDTIVIDHDTYDTVRYGTVRYGLNPSWASCVSYLRRGQTSLLR